MLMSFKGCESEHPNKMLVPSIRLVDHFEQLRQRQPIVNYLARLRSGDNTVCREISDILYKDRQAMARSCLS